MAEVTIGNDDYPAFADTDFADLFLGGDVARAALWAIRNDDAKGRGLVSATRMLLALPWCATPPDPAADTAPDVVKEVAAMLASDLLAKPALFADASGDSNIRNAKAGSVSVEFFKPIEGGPPIPRALWRLLVAANLVGCSPIPTEALDGAIISGIADRVRLYDDACRPLRGWDEADIWTAI